MCVRVCVCECVSGQHTLPALVFEMLSVVHEAYWKSGDADPFTHLNKHHLNNGGMLASLLCHSEYKVDQHPATTNVTSVAALGAIFTVLCRIIRIHGGKAVYFDGLLSAAMEHLLNLYAATTQTSGKITPPVLFPALKKSSHRAKQAHNKCLQNSYVLTKELEHTAAMLIEVFAARSWDDEMTHEAIDRGMWLQRLSDGDTFNQETPLLDFDTDSFTWQNNLFRPLSFADVEVLLVDQGHIHSLFCIRAMREQNQKQQSPFPLVFIEFRDIHASSVAPSLEKVVSRDRFHLVTYLSESGNCYNTLLVAHSQVWSAYQAYSVMNALVLSSDTESRDVTRLPFAPLLFQMLAGEGETRDLEAMRVACSVLGNWIGIKGVDPVSICNEPEKEQLSMRSFRRLVDTQRALQELLAGMAEELAPGHLPEERWSNMVTTAKALIAAILKPDAVNMEEWAKFSDLVLRGYYEYKSFVPIAQSILAATTPPANPEQKSDEIDTTYQKWFQFQSTVLRPRVESVHSSACNHRKGAGESFFRLLIQMEMESRGHGPTAIEKLLNTRLDPEGDTTMSDSKSMQTSSHAYHGCLSMFDPALAWILPETELVYANTRVFFFRRQYHQECDLSDTFLWFKWSFLHRIDARMFEGYNHRRRSREVRPVMANPKAKRPAPIKTSRPEDKRPPAKKTRVETVPQPRVVEMYSPTSPAYDPNSPTSSPVYSSTSPSPFFARTDAVYSPSDSPCSPAYSPDPYVEPEEKKAKPTTAAERQAEWRRSQVDQNRAAKAQLHAEKMKHAPPADVQQRQAQAARQQEAALRRLR